MEILSINGHIFYKKKIIPNGLKIKELKFD